MTPTTTPDPELVRMLDEAAEQYFHSLPLEHFAQATDHADQRRITLQSFAVIKFYRPDIQLFNELLIQYPRGGELGQVVPDNFAIIHLGPIQGQWHFSTHVQPVRPFLVLDYVSRHNKRKDYDANAAMYRELGVPYYFLFYPGTGGLTVSKWVDGVYVPITPNAAGRLEIPELELEAGVCDRRVRYWFRGERVPLVVELKRMVDDERARVEAERVATVERQSRVAFEEKIARLRAEIARSRGEGP